MVNGTPAIEIVAVRPTPPSAGLCPHCLLESGLAETVTTQKPRLRLAGNRPEALPDFGVYHTIGVLGEGGMGIVYLAEQREPIRRTLLSRLASSLPSPEPFPQFRPARAVPFSE
jgi:hypothetical protein